MMRHLPPITAPTASFLAEEAYGFFQFAAKKESVFLEQFPAADWKDESVERVFASLFPLRDNLNKRLEIWREKKEIRSSLEAGAKLVLPSPPPLSPEELTEFFLVSDVIFKKGKPYIEPFKAEGEKCARCWMLHPALDFRGFCPKCVRNTSLP